MKAAGKVDWTAVCWAEPKVVNSATSTVGLWAAESAVKSAGHWAALLVGWLVDLKAAGKVD